MVEFNHDKVPLYKLVIHSAQIVLSITMWILQIVVFRSDGDINGQNGWTFGVVRISQPSTSPVKDLTSIQDTSSQVTHIADIVSAPLAVLPFRTSMDLPHNGPSLPTSRQHRPA